MCTFCGDERGSNREEGSTSPRTVDGVLGKGAVSKRVAERGKCGDRESRLRDRGCLVGVDIG